ncbi:hypothetical protein PFAG_05887 [Plasmodium falciparum Santa Lucia]|uniref:Uncharacterized protein n=8 Tax=Plasmodium falciparum TaxID=5833 RepID=A0A0L1IH44_PLAFA|nr:hypothetical protein PFFVO_00144 [Plasmodium falciparum Vietnam Oak-Knoll (FVO)]ETW43504.1 hypothetical protein PFNF135_02041 [Plasmodium falciparum NF135/5.C10]ETW48424.1 hypothetical protein PFMALIP_03539 [Plasmodium falciparum MaliPS096_E11]ETW57330.1 hypothetical protein PFUGPA_00670 [Plasmodium falciparum Palo Alto/Uganda]EUT79320.1 hypothetical protein PFAG_05887 [Plasmodium falciparum Santa Lucia]EWC91039.1 hypothetical protein PFNF54_00143 [Plasmodium falciparum NF54]KNG75490.1 hyp
MQAENIIYTDLLKDILKKYIEHPQLSSLIYFQTVQEYPYYKYYPDRQKYKETIL